MADAQEAQAKEQISKANEEKKKQVEQAYHASTPTPTQEENDLAALGVHTDEHADDGSGPSPEFKMVNVADPDHPDHPSHSGQRITKQSEANKPAAGNYQTRAAAPASTRETTPKPPQQS